MELHGVTKLQILEWHFFVPSSRGTCVMIMLINQLLDMPHLSPRRIILAVVNSLLGACQKKPGEGLPVP
jgi:hypothetical protein